MNCPECREAFIVPAYAIGDMAICPVCGEIAVVAMIAPLTYRRLGIQDRTELNGCENGQRLLMYSELLRAKYRGSSAPTEGHA